MKKTKILWILLGIIIISILFTNISFAQDSTKVNISTVYNDIKHGVNNNAPKIEQALGTIARNLKVTADQVWNILVKQQKVWSLCFLLLTISALTNWYILYKRNIYVINPKYEKVKVTISKLMYDEGVTKSDSETYLNSSRYQPHYRDVQDEEIKLIPNSTISWFKYLHLIICLVLSIFSYLHFAQMLTGFMNPEYGAMQTIAEVAKSLK